VYEGLVDRGGAPTPRYAAAAAINARLRVLSEVLAPVFFRGGYQARRAPADEPVTSDAEDLDLAFYGTDTTTSHVLAVNRRSEEARTVVLRATDGVALLDVTTGEALPRLAEGAQVALQAGEFRLFAVRR
jgi:hypothetical protein